MLRLIHNQLSVTPGAILVDDVDDGLPNKEVHRLGSTADPKAYQMDGYANKPKQACYVPRVKITDPTIAGYIDLNQTPRVTFSAGKGKIAKLTTVGWISVVSHTAAQIVAPTLATAAINVPGAGDLTLTGTTFLSITPEITSVILTGTGAVTLTATQILGGGGTISATSIFIPAALVPGIAAVTTFAKVRANAQTTATVAVS